MKVLLLRVGALGTVVMLGWIAIAHAQRGSDDSATVVESSDANPLRDAEPAAQRPKPAVVSPSNSPAAKRTVPPVDPFGLQSRRNSDSLAAGSDAAPNNVTAKRSPLRDEEVPASSRYSQRAAPASSEQVVSGPELAVDDRSASRKRIDRKAESNASGNRRGGTDNQEPAPFTADPFAMPANPTRAAQPDRGLVAASNAAPLSAPVENARPLSPSTELEGTGQPGAQHLEGVQSPQLTVQKLAPKEVQVGKPANFRLVVRNVGQTPASDVEIRDQVPKGARLLGTIPQASRGPRGEVVWTLGTVRPNEESTVEMQLMPMAEGEIGSVATVHFGADASARTVATRPQLKVESVAPAKSLIGDKVMLTITVSNPGSGVATGVVLEEHIPAGMKHPAGAELEYEVGDLKPGESRKLELPLVANRAGPVTNVLNVRGDGNLRAEHKLNLEVLAPQLDVAMEGPKRRYLERQATYQLSVSNPGTAAAKQVELVANLPAGLKFIRANNAGYYEESTRTVRWRLEELPANEVGNVELVTMPVEPGRHAIKLRGTAQKGLAVEKEQPVVIEGIAAILFQVADTADPLEVGGETNFEVHVVNQGSKASGNVRLTVILPPEFKALAAEGPSRYEVASDRVVFESLASLAPKAETTYRIRVKALRSGDLRTRFELMTDDMQRPVTKEESTRVFADE